MSTAGGRPAPYDVVTLPDSTLRVSVVVALKAFDVD